MPCFNCQLETDTKRVKYDNTLTSKNEVAIYDILRGGLHLLLEVARCIIHSSFSIQCILYLPTYLPTYDFLRGYFSIAGGSPPHHLTILLYPQHTYPMPRLPVSVDHPAISSFLYLWVFGLDV
ncbi:hypothetical protein ElyMa_001305000 [Elysia marginata]|uniref:Uncharacterized protein n=1 Tax=Elysia marginata TaxID=1093978 RepID=A0AAV4IH84_9GAST|nr:hypothetical protein ElyMa_001305000 [Elysia marginata]